MNCHATRAVLDLYVEGRLTARAGARVDRHLQGCPACSNEARLLRPEAAPAAAAPASLKARLRRSLAGAPPKPPAAAPARRSDARSGMLLGAAFAAALAALHALTPAVLSERPVSQDAPLWRTP